MPQTRAFGSWPSPLSAELCTAAQHGVGQLMVNGDTVMITESRPQEAGRTVLMRRDDDGWQELTKKEFNTRTRLHEYGGLAYGASGEVIVAINHADQRLYRLDDDQAQLVALTPPSDNRWRYAEPQIDAARGCVYAVAEEHQSVGEPINRIVRIPLSAGKPETLVEGDDFYAYPRLSSDGQSLAWIAWNHPDMPWDASQLWRASLTADGQLTTPIKVAGASNEAIIQPEWRPDGQLLFISDRSGFWNIVDQTGQSMWEIDADCGGPLWQLGSRWYTPLDDGRLLASYTRGGQWQLALIEQGSATVINLPFVDVSEITAHANKAYFRAAAVDEPACVVEFDLIQLTHQIIYRSGTLPVDKSFISTPQSLEFTSQGRKTFAHFYPPTNPDVQAPIGEKPPLIVLCHGGPTSAASQALRLNRQFWTSRGFAICDVDYGGSTGYGRAYRDRLKGQWGIVDVEDCTAAARHLVDIGLVDPQRLIIRGGSAGGFTVLAALTFFDVFKAGASAYGIGDLELLAGDTHKFESRYLDSLIGPYPETRDRYIERSPIHSVDQLTTPVIFFQGLDDKVVPPNQAETMVNALKHKGVPVAYLAFEGEGHGFRLSATKISELLSELAFYAAIFGLEPADSLPELFIHNV